MRGIIVSALLLLASSAASPRPGEPHAPGPGPGNPEAGKHAGAEVEATSLLGRPLTRPELPPEVRDEREADLAAARAALRARPRDEDALIWVGRRLAYLGRYRDAIDVYTRGLAIHPDSHKLLRHRGHRFITVRRLEDAVSDLRRAADLIEGLPDEVEPDGLPNPRNLPRSTSHTNIHYHLGLARYLRGEFEAAAGAWRRCLDLSPNDDMRCAASYWLYLTSRRLGRTEQAAAILEPITADMEVIENHAYHELLRLYQGALEPRAVLDAEPGHLGAGIDDATRGYGIGAWHLIEGRRDEAFDVFRGIVEATAWPAFGHVAAEAELARAREARGR